MWNDRYTDHRDVWIRGQQAMDGGHDWCSSTLLAMLHIMFDMPCLLGDACHAMLSIPRTD